MKLPAYDLAFASVVSLLSASSTTHSLIPLTRPFLIAAARALACTPTKAGTATAESMARTAITTTNSTSEKPSSPGFVFKAFCTFFVFTFFVLLFCIFCSLFLYF